MPNTVILSTVETMTEGRKRYIFLSVMRTGRARLPPGHVPALLHQCSMILPSDWYLRSTGSPQKGQLKRRLYCSGGPAFTYLLCISSSMALGVVSLPT